MQDSREILVKAYPESGEDRVIPDPHNPRRYLVYTRATAQHGAANRAVQLLLADYFLVPAKNIILRSGHTNTSKQFLIYTSEDEITSTIIPNVAGDSKKKPQNGLY